MWSSNVCEIWGLTDVRAEHRSNQVQFSLSYILHEKRRWAEVTDHVNELPEENVGCHKARQNKNRINQKKSKPTRDSSRSDKKETSHVVWPRIKNVRGQTACQPEHYIAIYREDAAEVVHARSGSIIYIIIIIIINEFHRDASLTKTSGPLRGQEDLNRLQLNMKEAMDIVRDRQEWRHRISTSSSPLGWQASKKKKTSYISV